MNQNEEFEKILNVNNAALEKNTGAQVETDLVSQEYYKYVLEVILIIALKISGHYKLEMWIANYKFLMSYKHKNALTQLEE